VYTDESREDEDHYFGLLVRQRVDGIIAAAAHQKRDVFNLAAKTQIPIVFSNRSLKVWRGLLWGRLFWKRWDEIALMGFDDYPWAAARMIEEIVAPLTNEMW
jgi:hypothetical protein